MTTNTQKSALVPQNTLVGGLDIWQMSKPISRNPSPLFNGGVTKLDWSQVTDPEEASFMEPVVRRKLSSPQRFGATRALVFHFFSTEIKLKLQFTKAELDYKRVLER